MSEPLALTVAICSLNRAASLQRTLRSIEASAAGAALPSWELLVVDNGSTDDTAQIVAGFERRLPIRYVVEPRKGLSNARNLVLKTARGAFVACTDDDVAVGPRWLAAYAAFLAEHPGAGIVAGRIKPRFEPAPPAWIEDNRDLLKYAYAECDHGDAVVKLSVEANILPIGANFGFRRSLAEGRLFEAELGVAPGRPRLGEETLFLRGLLERGAEGWYLPGAEVEHIIGPDRQTVAYIDRYQLAVGESYAVLTSLGVRPNFLGGDLSRARLWRGAPLYFIRESGLYRLLSLLPAAIVGWRAKLRWRMRWRYAQGALRHWRSHPFRPS